jgi:DNA-binding PadR family transcriptional regulator
MSATGSSLTPAAVNILVALQAGPLHGYAIMSDVAALTDGDVRLAPGTLYTNIKRLLSAGLIEETDPWGEVTTDGPPRRYYRLTTAGEAALAAELDRMEHLVRHARAAGSNTPGTA